MTTSHFIYFVNLYKPHNLCRMCRLIHLVIGVRSFCDCTFPLFYNEFSDFYPLFYNTRPFHQVPIRGKKYKNLSIHPLISHRLESLFQYLVPHSLPSYPILSLESHASFFENVPFRVPSESSLCSLYLDRVSGLLIETCRKTILLKCFACY